MIAVADLSILSATISRELRRHRSALAQEDMLQDTIAAALTDAGLAFEREVVLGPGERLDFLLTETSTALEIKKLPATHDTWRQVARYLAHDRVTSCIVIAPRVDVPAPSLAGKPIAALALWKFLL